MSEPPNVFESDYNGGSFQYSSLHGILTVAFRWEYHLPHSLASRICYKNAPWHMILREVAKRLLLTGKQPGYELLELKAKRSRWPWDFGRLKGWSATVQQNWPYRLGFATGCNSPQEAVEYAMRDAADLKARRQIRRKIEKAWRKAVRESR